jgi:glycosyltransferase involved in cell wall biosynthesis
LSVSPFDPFHVVQATCAACNVLAMTRCNQELRVVIVLSTYNGERFLPEQLESLLAQSHQNWVLHWRDDGSSDGTVALMERFTRRAGESRCVHLCEPAGRMGPTGSFLALLRAVHGALHPGDVLAFADQDDVWLPEKLERGVLALSTVPDGVPGLYCARQILVDARLHRIGLSVPVAAPCGFPAALAQNVATGCTLMLNRAAARLVAASRPAPPTLHDWWCYLLVTAAGGQLVQDSEPVILYRQHRRNVVGAPTSMGRRALAALWRGPSVFMAVLRANVAALLAQPELLSDQARADVAAIEQALQGGLRRRWSVLRMPGLARQNWAETILFRCWFLIG